MCLNGSNIYKVLSPLNVTVGLLFRKFIMHIFGFNIPWILNLYFEFFMFSISSLCTHG